MSEFLLPSLQGHWTEPTKFEQLRIKTEMQLVHLIHAELDVGIFEARRALKSADAWDVAEKGNHRAERAHGQALQLIRLVAEITVDERRRMESKMEHLRRMLKSLSAIGSKPSPAEDEIAVLARALWEARDCSEGLPDDDWFRAERALKIQKELHVLYKVS